MVWPLPSERGSTLTRSGVGGATSIGTSNVPAAPWVLRDATPTRVSPADADGVTEMDAELTLAPRALSAVMEQV